MVIELGKDGLLQYVINQMDYFFPDGNGGASPDQMKTGYDLALEKLEFCFKRITPRLSFKRNGETYMNHLHSDSYCMFLYWYANSLFQLYGDLPECSKLMLLNRALHSVFISYKCKLPSFFLISHAVGSVIGNAQYEDGLVIFQNVTVNSANNPIDGNQPILGKYCFLGAGAKIIGNPQIGNYATIGANVCINNFDVTDRSIVYVDRQTGSSIIKPISDEKAKKYAASFFLDT